jgi:glycosyltransferase involved in cell wall biosynthesis
MACGIPVLASACGETERIIKEAECGLVSEIGSADGLVELILKFDAMTENQRDKMKQSAVVYNEFYFNKSKLFNHIEVEIAFKT